MWVWDLKWRRVWFECEKILVGELESLLERGSIGREGEDDWYWVEDDSTLFSVKPGIFDLK